MLVTVEEKKLLFSFASVDVLFWAHVLYRCTANAQDCVPILSFGPILFSAPFIRLQWLFWFFPWSFARTLVFAGVVGLIGHLILGYAIGHFVVKEKRIGWLAAAAIAYGLVAFLVCADAYASHVIGWHQ